MGNQRYRTLCKPVIATLAVAVIAAAHPASAHDDDHHRIRGDKLKMSDPAGDANKRKFSFKTKRQVSINDSLFDDDPTVLSSYLIVRNPADPTATSQMIELDPAKWSPVGSRGYRYKDDPRYAASSGINKIDLKTSSAGGSLMVKARGAFWPYPIGGEQDSVEVLLTIGTDMYCASFDNAALVRNEAGKVQGKNADPPGDCPSACGNSLREIGEQCDDGNGEDTDTCSNTCFGCEPQQEDFASTFDAIQELIFDSPVYNCSTDLCHGSFAQGGLDLRAGNSYASLVGVASQIDPSELRVFPGDDDRSMLYNKLANKLNGAPTIPGSPMPQNAPAITEELLDVVRLWIRGGAPADGAVDGTAELLGSCLPEPAPLKMPQPDPPAPGEGIQVGMPGWPMPAQHEDEICIPSFYDVSASVPPAMQVDCPGAFPGTNDPPNGTGKCFAYDANHLFQDAQSHHSIVHIYAGAYDVDDASWGTWTCYLGDNDGQPCDPDSADPCPGGGICGGDWKPGVACLSAGGFGPPDYGNFGGTAPTFSGSQEPTQSSVLPAGVYALLPLRGVIVWNSHAFNLTGSGMNMEGWINLEFTDDLQWPARRLFNSSEIFVQEVPPFESREYCWTHTFGHNAHVFSMSSHMHRFGKRWRYYEAPQTPCTDVATCTPGNEADKFYESFDYSDPVTLEYEPAKVYSGSVEDRTIKFCALYDNGETDPAEVKTYSGSPCPPIFASCPNGTGIGGPCPIAETACLGGPNKGQVCAGNDALCPDSVCDACTMRGGVTTEDEMFIAIGGLYYP